MTSNPKFNNRDNKVYKTEDGEVWASRSCAIVGAILFVFKEELFVLAEKRSEKMDSPNLWCIPCGYMDWDETGPEALIREVYEETGLYLPDYAEHSLLNMDDPFYVMTDPKENRQNISLSYTNVYRFEDSDEEKFNLVLSTIEKFKCEEVQKAKLIKISNINRYKWAFNHENRIKSAVDYVHEVMVDLLSTIITNDLFDMANQESEETLPWWKQILTFWKN